jgi:chitin disaccharide deacetylase
MNRRAIVNADDLGISESRSRGILEAHQKGIVTSTTLLANSPHMDSIAQWLRECPKLGVGVHLNLSEGKAILSHPRSLTDDQGRFLGTEETRRRLMEGRFDREEMQTEFDLQIRRVRDLGIEPTHLDSHQHIHLYPAVMSALCWAAQRHGITKVRLPREPVPAPGSVTPSIYWELVRFQGLVPKAAQDLASAGLRTPDHFRGITLRGGLHFDRFLDMMARLPEGTTEVMVHPGHREPAGKVFSTEDRERELRLLTDPETRKAIENYGIELITYGSL